MGLDRKILREYRIVLEDQRPGQEDIWDAKRMKNAMDLKGDEIDVPN